MEKSGKVGEIYIIMEINPETSEIIHIHGRGYSDFDKVNEIKFNHNCRYGESESYMTKFRIKKIAIDKNDS